MNKKKSIGFKALLTISLLTSVLFLSEARAENTIHVYTGSCENKVTENSTHLLKEVGPVDEIELLRTQCLQLHEQYNNQDHDHLEIRNSLITNIKRVAAKDISYTGECTLYKLRDLEEAVKTYKVGPASTHADLEKMCKFSQTPKNRSKVILTSFSPQARH